MAGRSYGNVMKAGAASVAASRGSRRGPSNKNLASGANRRPSPTGDIKSKTGPIKGRDRGTG